MRIVSVIKRRRFLFLYPPLSFFSSIVYFILRAPRGEGVRQGERRGGLCHLYLVALGKRSLLFLVLAYELGRPLEIPTSRTT